MSQSKEEKLKQMARDDANGVGHGGYATGGGYAEVASIERNLSGMAAFEYEQEYKKAKRKRQERYS